MVSFDALYRSFFGSSVEVAPEYLLLSLPIAWLAYKLGRRSGGFWRWLLPRRIYAHPSHRLDLVLFVIGRLLAFSGIFTRLSAAPLVAAGVVRLIGRDPAAPPLLGPVALALLMWVLSDFLLYWIHRWFHHLRPLWPLHAVHHSAEVLTPFTAFRQHPGALLVSSVVYSVLIGAAQGVLVGTLDPDTTIATIAGINAFIVLAHAALANFQHSHVWISYGRVLEHVFISPAQHQIHHSTDPAHYGRNFGTMLALWDWMFGTLYVIRGAEDITFGLTDRDDAPLATHRLGPVMLSPLRRMIGARP
ncbi:MAG: fatty acid hydroxylase [Limimaricola sp.]|uniref:sterol desaturase family protein n=1 Tax=Limimaricola sp. TaxID=2211665 RepID=UPI001D663C25|nr:sterol desaturase family protein [Limimaricola sp.]MBI1418151.1 fatty acid hydroxylase [Limimaricola sp.]